MIDWLAPLSDVKSSFLANGSQVLPSMVGTGLPFVSVVANTVTL